MTTEPAVGTDENLNTSQGAPAAPTAEQIAATKAASDAAAAAQAAKDKATKEAAADVIEPTPYEPSGDPALDLALEFVGNLGIAFDHPAMKAAVNGDFTLIEATLGAMGDKAKGFERFVQIAKDAQARAQVENDKASAAVTAVVHQVAGGEEQWKTIQAWASKEATKEEKAALNEMFDAGPIQARAAAQMIVDQYNKAPGTVKNPASATRKGASQSDGDGKPEGRLTRRELVREIDKLRGRLGANFQQSPEYSALHARFSR